MKWNFRNLLALITQAEIIGVWVAQGMGILPNLPEQVTGALIVVFTLMFQFYFRKKPEDEVPEGAGQK